MLYVTKKPHIINTVCCTLIGKEISKIVQHIDQTRPTCGTQRMVAILSRMSNRLVNRKKYRKYTHVLVELCLKRSKNRSYVAENNSNLQDLISFSKQTHRLCDYPSLSNHLHTV